MDALMASSAVGALVGLGLVVCLLVVAHATHPPVTHRRREVTSVREVVEQIITAKHRRMAWNLAHEHMRLYGTETNPIPTVPLPEVTKRSQKIVPITQETTAVLPTARGRENQS